MYRIVVTFQDGTTVEKARNLRFLKACDRLNAELDKAVKNPHIQWVDMVAQAKENRS